MRLYKYELKLRAMEGVADQQDKGIEYCTKNQHGK